MSDQLYYDFKRQSGMTPSLSTQVTRELGRSIVSGKYLPGSLLPDEAALAERYRVSRAVIRDAVKILVGKGILDVRRGIGTRVRPRTDWGMLDNDVLAWRLSDAPDATYLRKLIEIREMFEPRAARWAAERATDESVDVIASAYRQMEIEQGSIEDFIVADARFHSAILHAADNEILSALEGVIYSALLSSIRLTNRDPRDNKASLPIHRKVYEAIAARNPSLSEKTMKRLLADATRRLEPFLVE